jgi:hypothetical protein
MRTLTTIIFVIITFTAQGQIGISKNSIKIQDLAILKKLSYTTDTLGNKYLSQTLKYDTYGREIFGQNLTKSGDVTSEDITTYSGDSLEVTIYHEEDIVDTSICKYDKLGRKYYEYWYWSDESDSEETFYYYKDHTDTLICIHDIYSWGQYFDSLYYKNNLLVKKQLYDLENGIEKDENYVYKDTLLLEKTIYNYITKFIDSKETYLYNDQGFLEKLIIENFDTHRKLEKRFSYYDNGLIKEELITQYENSNFSESSVRKYDNNGLQIQSKFQNANGKLTQIDYEYFKNY